MKGRLALPGKLGNILKWQYLASAAQGALGALYMLLLARVLGVAQFGVFSLVTAIVTTTSLLCEARMQEVVVKKFHILGENRKQHPTDGALHGKLYDYVAFEILTRSLPMAILALGAPWFLGLYRANTVDLSLVFLACFGFVISKSGNGTAIGLLRVMDRANFIALGTTVDWAMRLAVSALLALLGLLNVKAALAVSFASPALVNLWYVMTAHRIFHQQVLTQPSDAWKLQGFFKRMGDDARLILAQMGLSASDLMAKDLDILILSLSMTVESLGLYRAAKFLVQILWRAVDPFYLALLPEVQRLWSAKTYDALWDLLKRITLQLFVAAAVLILGLWVSLHFFGGHFFGKGYESLPSITPLMSLWLLCCAPLIWGGTLAFAIGRPEITLFGSLLGSLCGVGLFFALVPLFGLAGAAIAWSSTLAIGFAFTAIVSTLLARRLIARQVTPM